MPMTEQLELVDARPFVNAQANRLRKGGYEEFECFLCREVWERIEVLV